MGGTSGGLYSIFLTALVKQLKELKEISTQTVGEAFYRALHDGLFKYTRARVGGRTLIDTLQPFVDTLYETKGDLSKAIEEATKGCEKLKIYMHHLVEQVMLMKMNLKLKEEFLIQVLLEFWL